MQSPSKELGMNTLVSEPLAVKVSFDSDNMWIELADGRKLGAPLAYFPRLLDATPRQRRSYVISGGGTGVHWEDIDEDICVKALMMGIGDRTKPSRLLHDVHRGGKFNKDQSRGIETGALGQALVDLNECPIGRGDAFRDIVAAVLASSLGDLVDLQLTRREFPCRGSRGDFELPLRIESISKFPLWERWCDTYKISSIIVEVKNKKSQATPSDVAQILGYIVTANLGKFGILVSRNGFARNAMKQLETIRSTNEFLVLPFEQKDLEYLAALGTSGPGKCMDLFGRKATLLAQSA